MSDAKDTANRLLPAAILHPAFLLLAGVLPQVVLVFFNLRVYGIVCGELGPEGRSAYAVLFGGQGVLLAALLGAWAACRARRRMVGPAAAAGLLLLHAVFLWIVCSRAAGLVPSSVAFWMVNVGQVLFAQFALIAPLLFYVLIRLAGWGAGRVRAAVDIGASAGALVGIPAFWFLAARFLFDRRWFPHADSIFIPVVLFASTPVMLLAFLRLLLWGYAAVGQSMALLVVSGLLLPLGGLALNRSLPFPCDLQDWRVYALTVVNSAALCLPFSATRLRGGLPWMARAVMYPFSLYFFLLFLPFLPFSIPDRICTVSCSARAVVRSLWPGRRRSSCFWMSASVKARRDGQPSITAPMAGPCDSPNVVTTNTLPNEFPIIPRPSPHAKAMLWQWSAV